MGDSFKVFNSLGKKLNDIEEKRIEKRINEIEKKNFSFQKHIRLKILRH